MCGIAGFYHGDWRVALLDENRFRPKGFFHPEPIGTMRVTRYSGKERWQYHFLSVLMFQEWLEDQ